jgi:hypothetical protein
VALLGDASQPVFSETLKEKKYLNKALTKKKKLNLCRACHTELRLKNCMTVIYIMIHTHTLYKCSCNLKPEWVLECLVTVSTYYVEFIALLLRCTINV